MRKSIQKTCTNPVRIIFLPASTKKSAQEGAKSPAARKSTSPKATDCRLPTKPETNGSKKTDYSLVSIDLNVSGRRKLGFQFRKGPCSKAAAQSLFLSDASFCQDFFDDFGYKRFVGFFRPTPASRTSSHPSAASRPPRFRPKRNGLPVHPSFLAHKPPE